MQTNEEVSTTKLAQESLTSVLKLHDELIKSKDDLLQNLQEENIALKEMLISIQEDYEQDRDVMKILQSQIKHLQKEIDFTKRKYKLMWNQAIENYKKTDK